MIVQNATFRFAQRKRVAPQVCLVCICCRQSVKSANFNVDYIFEIMSSDANIGPEKINRLADVIFLFVFFFCLKHVYLYIQISLVYG